MAGSKLEMNQTSCSQKATVTLASVISGLREGDSSAVATYHKLCRQLDEIENWLPENITDFLEQFINISDILDASCKLIVEKFAGLGWHVVPLQVRKRYVNMLQKLAVHHVCHTETLISCFVSNLLPKVRPLIAEKDVGSSDCSTSVPCQFETLLSEEEQLDIYDMAFDAIKFVINCFPMTVHLLEESLRWRFPHSSAPLPRYEAYLRNILLIYEFAVDIRRELWKLLLENIAQLDSVISKKIASNMSNQNNFNANEAYEVFLLDEESERWNEKLAVESIELEQKLDTCLCLIFAQISKKHHREIPPEIAPIVKWTDRCMIQKDIYFHIRDAFETWFLTSPGLKCAPFIMLFLLSLDEKYLNNFTGWLWNFVLSPSQSPNDWKKAHSAACYLGGILSRAKFIDFRFFFGWLERMAKWCNHYVDEVVGGSAAASAGTLRHGVFYAVCQALLLAFSFRFREVVKQEELENVRHWGLGHIIHCTLQPLQYINATVALNFATISRSLQLVYCNHILPANYDDINIPFEPFFPFEIFYLKRSSLFVQNLTLQFYPIVEENCERWRRRSGRYNSISSQDNFEHGSLEFLEDLKRDKDLMNDSCRDIWPLVRSPDFEFLCSKHSPKAGAFTPSSIMDIS
ncbi:unnamed protein product [Enterobius vermicularis]|uniref:Uncharacterized protein n=1 Tax=Enterobius vermicularis TaxID=51028 RepID=A0A0N4V879_ENTVE|nr:unnamed protein product [Enterobius vermicularis]